LTRRVGSPHRFEELARRWTYGVLENALQHPLALDRVSFRTLASPVFDDFAKVSNGHVDSGHDAARFVFFDRLCPEGG
jgi:hypothetical protein